MKFLSYTPSSMISPLGSLGMFRKTKKKNWAFLGKRARSASPSRNSILDLGDFLSKDVEKTVKIKFNSKSGIYRFPNGRIITGKDRFSEVKIAARTMGYSAVKLGGLTVQVV